MFIPMWVFWLLIGMWGFCCFMDYLDRCDRR